MKRIVLFRFHNNFDVCINRVEIIRELNPGVSVFGLYGGRERDFSTAKDVLGNKLDDIYLIRDKSAVWKWLNSDLAVNSWYLDFGRQLAFDMLHVIEWDLLLLAPLSVLYESVPENSLGLTALTPLQEIQRRWLWTATEPFRTDWIELMDRVREENSYNSQPLAALCGGICLSRAFVQQYASTSIPELCHDEIRIPLFAQILGFELKDNGLCKGIFDDRENSFFSWQKNEIALSTIATEMSKPKGRKAFHPYYHALNLKSLVA